MNVRKIVIEKRPDKEYKAKRRMIEIDPEVHEQLWKLSAETHQPMRDIVEILLWDALKYVEIREDKIQ